MNNKGQSLVSFILIIPILFLVLFMVYEIGKMSISKSELNSINYIAMSYGIDKLELDNTVEEVKELINKNKSDIDIVNVDIKDNKLYISLSYSYKAGTSLFKRSNLLRVKSNYVGYIENNKKIIKKNR